MKFKNLKNLSVSLDAKAPPIARRKSPSLEDIYKYEQLNANIPFMEQYVLSGIRLWSIGHRHGSDLGIKINEVFTRAGAPNAARSLDRLMNTIIGDLQRPFTINCNNISPLSEDENLILNAVAQCQVGNSEVIRFWLDDVIPHSLWTLVIPLFEEFTADLIEGGIYMSQQRIHNATDFYIYKPTADTRLAH